MGLVSPEASPFFHPVFDKLLYIVRVLHISSARTFGGGERHLVDLARGLMGRGHEIFVGLRPTSEWHEQVAFVPPERTLKVSIRNSFGMFSANRIARFVRANEIDIVHAHVARDYLAASAAVRVARTPKFVLTRHVMFAMKPFHRFALRNVDRAIAVSSGVERQLARIFPAEKIRVVPNGIVFRPGADRDRLGASFRSDHGIAADVPIIVSIGELKVLKGQRDLVLAANEVLKTVPRAQFVVAGMDNTLDQGFRRELRRLVRVLGIEDRFLWLDWVDDTQPLLAAADLFVSPSHSESFGLAMLEAMAAGCPVIATETHGARELIDRDDALVPIKDPLALSTKIIRYLSNRIRRADLARHQEQRARSRYGSDEMVAATEAIYREICPRV